MTTKLIKKLINEATVVRNGAYSPPNNDHFDREQFAKLVIRDCLLIIEDMQSKKQFNDASDIDCLDNYTHWLLGKAKYKIKKAFGVTVTMERQYGIRNQ